MALSSVERTLRYDRTIVTKQCVECGAPHRCQRNQIPVCSAHCRSIRTERFRPKTFLTCQRCGQKFGPVSRLSKKFCSNDCKYESLRTGLNRPIRTGAAQRAQRRVAYAVQTGKLVRPTTCDECGQERKIEAAHYDYSDPMRVRWLCIPCHRKWDKEEPKGGTIKQASVPAVAEA